MVQTLFIVHGSKNKVIIPSLFQLLFGSQSHGRNISTYVLVDNNRALLEAKLFHANIVQTKPPAPNVSLHNKLVSMYAKCGKLAEAHKVFDEMSERDAVSWTALIAVYARRGCCGEALALFNRMHDMGVRPDHFTFASVLPSCADLTALKQIHGNVFTLGFHSDVFVGNTLVDRYAKCGILEDARQVFDEMPQRNVVSWNSLIAGYMQNGHVGEALELFQEMPKRDITSWNVMIAGYARNGYVNEAGKLFEEMPVKDVVSWNAMTAGYAQNAHLDEAFEIFQRMPQRNVVSWNTMIGGFVQNGHAKEALKIYRQMEVAGGKPNEQTFPSVLSACASLAALEQGKEIHEAIIRLEFESNVIVASALVDMYAKCGSMENAWDMFNKVCHIHQDVILWNCMIAAYVHNGHFEEALECFQKMPKRDTVSWNIMIGAYAQKGLVDQALKVFQEMPNRNEISWNTMIVGYSQNGHAEEALDLFRQMQSAGLKPSLQTFAGILPACANLAALTEGKEIHEKIMRSGFLVDIFVGSALVDMYAKCGSLDDARCIFYKMPRQNVVSWNAMIAGYAVHGCGNEALKLFKDMQQSCISPDHITFVGVLSACCHAGLVEEGWRIFNLMTQFYHITPTAEHYGCMVGLLGRAGHLAEAKSFIDRMHIKPDATLWLCLLGACRIHGNISLGKQVAECIMALEPNDATPYVLLSNIYAEAGRWDCTEKVRKRMNDRGLKKELGSSWTEVNKNMHTFIASVDMKE